METLVVVAQHKNQYYGRVKPNGPARFSSSPSRNFRDINCRAFESGAGILPTPVKTLSAPITKRSTSYISFPSSPKTPSPSVNCNSQSFDTRTKSKTSVKSKPIAINLKTQKNERSFKEKFSCEFETFSYSELWAGPAYSNSPPPSSLPIPKFSMRPKRTVSLDLPVTVDSSDIEMHHPIAKSAPASPTREHIGCTRDMFLSADSATKTLRRILNLDSADE
ncbi:Flocculation FLO11-like protein [Melia azedarach]|uniref:Flocculation FLO11-like protein n=1 Tax=Melia azedarach TaxID=155640 RepID=A0ACC1YVS2_MELAZ|nr:Flocculation FLO11-like protein [Melia azedarach]